MRRESAFPLPLWASLLLALLLLTQPAVVARIESIGGFVLSLPLRAVAIFSQEIVAASKTDESRAQALDATKRLTTRRATIASVRPDHVDPSYVALPVRVVERGASGAHGPTELVLELRADELADVAAFVTLSDELIGFVADRPVEDDPSLAGLARVFLLSHVERGRLPRRVPASIETQDGTLSFLVEPSSSVDRWPLRCVLLDDPYRAARVGAVTAPVRSSGLVDDPLGALPKGLILGELRVFGYQAAGQRVLPIGFHVAPQHAQESLDYVTLWRRARAVLPTRAVRTDAVSVRLLRLPVPAAGRERYLATSMGAETWLRSGAALVEGARLLGICEDAGFGFAVVAPFGLPGRRWSLCFLPADGGPTLEFVARAVDRDGTRVSLKALVDAAFTHAMGDHRSREGELFVAAMSRDLPGGLYLGPAELHANGGLTVTHVELDGRAGLAVLLHAGVRERRP